MFEVPIGHQAQASTRGELAGALSLQPSTGIVVHRMIQVKGWITQDEIRPFCAVIQHVATRPPEPVDFFKQQGIGPAPGLQRIIAAGRVSPQQEVAEWRLV